MTEINIENDACIWNFRATYICSRLLNEPKNIGCGAFNAPQH